MPKIESWGNLPEGIRQHLVDRMRDRAISIADLNQLRLWIESKPEVSEGGTKTSARSRSAATDRFQKHSSFAGKRLGERPSNLTRLLPCRPLGSYLHVRQTARRITPRKSPRICR